MMGFKVNMKKIVAFLLLVCMMITVLPLGQVQAAKTVKLNKTALSMKSGDTYQLKLSGTTKVSWTTSNKAIATVSYKGVVSAIDNGTATITAKDKKSGKTYKCKVTVKNTMHLDKESVFIEGIGESASIKLLNSKSTTYKSWDTKIATVDKNGKITGVAPGTCTVVAVNNVSKKVFKCAVTVAMGTLTYEMKDDTESNWIYSLGVCNYVSTRFHVELNEKYNVKVFDHNFNEIDTGKSNNESEIIIPWGNTMEVRKEGTYWLLISGKYWLKLNAERHTMFIQPEFLPKEIDYSNFDSFISSAKNGRIRKITDTWTNIDYFAEDNEQFSNCVIKESTHDDIKQLLFDNVKNNIMIDDCYPYTNSCISVTYNYSNYQVSIVYVWDDNYVIKEISYILKKLM